MDNTTISTANAAIVTVSILEFIMGETFNVGILVVSSENLKRGNNVAELIYFFMGFANIFIQAMLTVLNLFYNHWPDLFNKREVYLALFTLFSCLMQYSSWLTAWLCAHYCITIANINHPALVRLKRVLSSFRLHVFVMSILPFVLCLVPIWFVSVALDVQCPDLCTFLSTFHAVHVLSPAYTTVNLLVTSILPFALSFLSTGITAFSLIRHMWRMKQKSSGMFPPNLQVVINATKTMILFLTLSVSFYVSELLIFLMTKLDISQILRVTSWLVVMSYPTAQAAIIIQANSKMKTWFLGRFCAWTLVNKT
ncbi:taste receptor type 2 member 40-like [Rana temporaria]|uniref:taste receptor type 2 member 40-like n=1 Tax=Rana temporaria TaxID=8407 RepID=UPI001AAD150F|nr:taste receptor type 2 member 40-like [Rana temporaria]